MGAAESSCECNYKQLYCVLRWYIEFVSEQLFIEQQLLSFGGVFMATWEKKIHPIFSLLLALCGSPPPSELNNVHWLAANFVWLSFSALEVVWSACFIKLLHDGESRVSKLIFILSDHWCKILWGMFWKSRTVNITSRVRSAESAQGKSSLSWPHTFAYTNVRAI